MRQPVGFFPFDALTVRFWENFFLRGIVNYLTSLCLYILRFGGGLLKYPALLRTSQGLECGLVLQVSRIFINDFINHGFGCLRSRKWSSLPNICKVTDEVTSVGSLISRPRLHLTATADVFDKLSDRCNSRSRPPCEANDTLGLRARLCAITLRHPFVAFPSSSWKTGQDSWTVRYSYCTEDSQAVQLTDLQPWCHSCTKHSSIIIRASFPLSAMIFFRRGW